MSIKAQAQIKAGSQQILSPAPTGLLQRKCACGNLTMMGGECTACSKKNGFGLQTKLKINKPGDIYEQEADRVADQVLATPAFAAVSGALPHIQRFSGQSNRQMDMGLASVDQALASPGRPLEPALRQDMEQRFGYDFSKVRLHSGPAAERSAKSVNAQAYTVGTDIVFGAERLMPGSQEGRRLLAHELTHVVQQSGGEAGLVGHAVASLAVQRKPNAELLSEAKDPIDEDDYPDYGWYYLMTGSSHGSPTFGYVRGVVRENTDVDRELLEEAAPEYHYRKSVKGGTIRPSYFAFRHLTEGVVARAFAELEGYHPELAPKGKELLKEVHPYKFYVFMPRAGNHRPLYAFPMPLSSAPPAPELPERRPQPEKKDEPATQSEKAPASGKVTWMEIDEGVFAVLVEGGLPLKAIAAYVSGHPDVPDALADLNGKALTTPIPETQPIIIPYEFVERRETLEKIPEPIQSRIVLLQKLRTDNAAYQAMGEGTGRPPDGAASGRLDPPDHGDDQSHRQWTEAPGRQGGLCDRLRRRRHSRPTEFDLGCGLGHREYDFQHCEKPHHRRANLGHKGFGFHGQEPELGRGLRRRSATGPPGGMQNSNRPAPGRQATRSVIWSATSSPKSSCFC